MMHSSSEGEDMCMCVYLVSKLIISDILFT